MSGEFISIFIMFKLINNSFCLLKQVFFLYISLYDEIVYIKIMFVYVFEIKPNI